MEAFKARSKALNRILDLAFAEFRTEGGTMIVPGHGRICDIADVAYYRDMVTIVRDRVQDAIKKGKTSRSDQGVQTHGGLGSALRQF